MSRRGANIEAEAVGEDPIGSRRWSWLVPGRVADARPSDVGPERTSIDRLTAAACYPSTTLVQNAQRCACSGIWLRHSGQALVTGSGTGGGSKRARSRA